MIKKSTLMRKHLKNGNVEKWAGSTIDCGLASSHQSFLLTTNFRKPNQNDFWNHSAELYSGESLNQNNLWWHILFIHASCHSCWKFLLCIWPMRAHSLELKKMVLCSKESLFSSQGVPMATGNQSSQLRIPSCGVQQFGGLSKLNVTYRFVLDTSDFKVGRHNWLLQYTKVYFFDFFLFWRQNIIELNINEFCTTKTAFNMEQTVHEGFKS